jgi:hypothetical protein
MPTIPDIHAKYFPLHESLSEARLAVLNAKLAIAQGHDADGTILAQMQALMEPLSGIVATCVIEHARLKSEN